MAEDQLLQAGREVYAGDHVEPLGRLAEEHEHHHGHGDVGNDDREVENRIEGLLAPPAEAFQGQGAGGAEYHGYDRGEEAYLDRHPDRLLDVVVVQECLIPAEGEALPVAHRIAVVEREDEQDHDRRVEEDEDEQRVAAQPPSGEPLGLSGRPGDALVHRFFAPDRKYSRVPSSITASTTTETADPTGPFLADRNCSTM